MQPRQDPTDINVCRNRSGTDIPQYHLLMLDVSEGPDCYELAVSGALPIMGVALEAIPDGQNGDMAQAGLAPVVAGGAISVGAKITGTTGGKAAASTTDEDHIVGVALTAATAEDDVIEVRLTAQAVQNASV